MECKRCGSEIPEGNEELCEKCRTGEEMANIPPGVYLNQTPGPHGRFDVPPLQTLAGKELAKKRSKLFDTLLIGLGIILFLLVLRGILFFLVAR